MNITQILKEIKINDKSKQLNLIKFEKYIRSYHKLMDDLYPFIYNMYQKKLFNKESHDHILNLIQTLDRKYNINYHSQYNFLEFFSQILDWDQLPIHSSGSFYSGLTDYDSINWLASEFDLDPESDEVYEIIDKLNI